jgi:probable FeS assembly SUF system protein SufT
MSSIRLTRDCKAVRIPLGSEATLDEGTEVSIAQTLGGSFTVQAIDGLYRIAAVDADALGMDPGSSDKPREPADATGQPLAEIQVWETLKTCFDPEIPVNIVDLGLVYDVKIAPLSSGQSKVTVKMTLTAPGCGMGSVIAGDAQQKLLYLAGVEEADVELVWDPPWHQSMITATGRRILGLE